MEFPKSLPVGYETENEPVIMLKEQHFEEKVTFKLRDGSYTLFKSVVMASGSPLLINKIGEGQFKTTTQEPDGSYALDCDKDIFFHIMAYVETGFLPTKRYNISYLNQICNKLGLSNIGKSTIEMIQSDTKCLVALLQKKIDEIKEPTFDLHVKFLETKVIDKEMKHIVRGSEIVVLVNEPFYHEVFMKCRRSEVFLEDLFKDLKKDGYEKKMNADRMAQISFHFFHFGSMNQKNRARETNRMSSREYKYDSIRRQRDEYRDDSIRRQRDHIVQHNNHIRTIPEVQAEIHEEEEVLDEEETQNEAIRKVQKNMDNYSNEEVQEEDCIE